VGQNRLYVRIVVSSSSTHTTERFAVLKLRGPYGEHEMRWWYVAFTKMCELGYSKSQADKLATIALAYRLGEGHG
jgi:hypothetical protein